ncbi:phage tail protein [Arsenophonus apicola]|uniref:Tail fiber protein n=1 Tax=Arsenophonus apicola TaxID=2879119 RepID=A0ABY8P0X4_9GAMM|nr:tail fiber protein [Arsenophonus apicola]WGO83128.1 tail fiber protein [Arsenophonus apicola]
MAKNEILPFAIADGANVLPADEYQKLTARNNGFSAGVARSQELNTVWRQASMIAHVVAQFIAETNNSDVLDDGNVDKLKAGLISALSKNVNNTVPAATKTVAGITKLSSATNSDDETQAATPKAVKIAYDLAKTVSIDGIYPVGIVIWFAQNKNPNTLFPNTKWQYIGENKTIRLAKADGSNVLTTGGADSIKLTEAQLPAHGHTFSGTTSKNGSHSHKRGSMNITGIAPHTPSWGAGIAEGAFYADGSYNAPGESARNGVLLHFDASRSWTGKTSLEGEHIHNVNGATSKTGNNSEVDIKNAFVTLMSWHRIS